MFGLNKMKSISPCLSRPARKESNVQKLKTKKCFNLTVLVYTVILGDEVDLYGLKGCKDWAQRKYCQYQNELDNLNKQIDFVTNLLIHRRVRRLEDLLNSFKEVINGCNNNFGDLNCNEWYGSNIGEDYYEI